MTDKRPYQVVVKIPDGVSTAILRQRFNLPLNEVQISRLAKHQHRRDNTFCIGTVSSVHPQRREATVDVPDNIVPFVRRVVLGEDIDPKLTINDFKPVKVAEVRW